MLIETLGHASLLIRDAAGTPLLLTDPWLIGSCYWRSWWLQSYPTAGQMEALKDLKYCYVTHEHPDHFHTASIRKLNDGVNYLCPQLPRRKIIGYLQEQGRKARALEPFQWHALSPEVSVLSIPLVIDDSVLLINTPRAFIVNFNDSKPARSQVRTLTEYMDRYAAGKKRILLSSYSPASIVNSFLRNNERVSLRDKKSYVSYLSRICMAQKIDYFMPFASQVIFHRSDSSWANAYKVTYDDLKQHWAAAGTRLLNPYARLDLDGFESSYIAPADYNHDANSLIQRAARQEEVDRSAEFTADDVDRLRQKLGRFRYFSALLFRKGIGFELGNTKLTYLPWPGKMIEGEAKGSFVLRIPTQALKDVLKYGHFGDLGITMFTLIILNERTDPRFVYVFFMLIMLHDYGHTVSVVRFLQWIVNGFRIWRWRIPGLGVSHS
ncbi:MAG: MBL fold metallo-hydrolase [Gammaproteobacteria bacterium]